MTDDARTAPAVPPADGSVQRRLAAGDREAFEQLVRAHQDYVARLAFRLLGWSGDAEDVVQDVFLAALRNVKSFRGQASPLTWLTAITVNQCRTRRRRQWVMDRLRWLWRRRPGGPDPPPADGPLAEAERSERVRRAVRRLPGRLREVVVLRYLQDQSVAEVARVIHGELGPGHRHERVPVRPDGGPRLLPSRRGRAVPLVLQHGEVLGGL